MERQGGLNVISEKRSMALFNRSLFLLLAVTAALSLAATWVGLAVAQQVEAAAPVQPPVTAKLPASGPAALVKDIAPGDDPLSNSWPNNFLTVGGITYFAAGNDLGTELWRTDGTAEGTWMVKDIWPGVGKSYPGAFYELNGWLLFWADDGDHGQELWRSDGTPEGTTLVKDLDPGGDGYSLGFANSAIFDGLLYFGGYDSLTGVELWRTDGTPEGTTLVKDIEPGGGNFYNIRNLAVANGKLFFTADDGLHGIELWVSDGTAAGTTLLMDIYPVAESSWPSNLITAGNLLFFTANDGVHGEELWISDGAPSGTMMVKDINPVAGYSGPSKLHVIGSTVYFSANDGVAGDELWKSDGTPGGTVMVMDIYHGIYGSYPYDLEDMGGILYFSARDDVSYPELWRSDGTLTGTYVIHLAPEMWSGPVRMTASGGLLYFAAAAGDYGEELWASDGTVSGTQMVKDMNPGLQNGAPYNLYDAGGYLLFAARDESHAQELWRSDGTYTGTFMVADLYDVPRASDIAAITAVGNRVYFRADDGITGEELWTSDGATTGTLLLADTYPGSGGGGPRFFTPAGNRMIFTAHDDSHGEELWASDGTPSGTLMLKDIYPGWLSSFDNYLTSLGDKVVFSARDGVHGEELWVSDGTPTGTLLLMDIVSGTIGSNPYNLIRFGGSVYFGVYDGVSHTLWATGGTPETTLPVLTLPNWMNSAYAVEGNGLFFTISPDEELGAAPPEERAANGAPEWDDEGGPVELWYSDGSPAGAAYVATLPNSPWPVAASGDLLYFNVFTYTTGYELWRSDGTYTGTFMVQDIIPGPGSSRPENLTNLNGILYFSAVGTEGGRELWRSDGTPQGTWQVADINPGPAGSALSGLSSAGGFLFFSANDGVHGDELWVSDGTAAGTVLAQDIYPGGGSGYPLQFAVTGSRIFFAATEGIYGYELWAAPLPQADLSVVKSDSADPVAPYSLLTYTLVIANSSDWPSFDTALTETLPDSLSFPSPDLIDNDDLAAGFGGGVFSGTQWDAANGWLELTGEVTSAVSGEFTSRIMDAGQIFDWYSLIWNPLGPYGLALPDWGQAEQYPAGSADMSGNLALWHFDEPSGAAAFADTGAFAGTSEEASGAWGHYPLLCWYDACPTSSSDAMFENALAFDGSSDYLKAVMPSGLVSNTSFTVAFWMKYQPQPSRQWLVEMGKPIGGRSVHWLINSDGSTQYGFRSAVQNQFNIADFAGQWAAVVTTYDASTGMLTSYVNGIPLDSDLTGPVNLTPTDIRFSIPQSGESRFRGLLDEFVIYGRALSASEVQALYLRGALRLGFQVRACDDPACSGEDFAGLDGASASFFSDSGATQAALTLPDTRFFQYRVTLSSLDAAYSPALEVMQVDGNWFSLGQGLCSGVNPLDCELGTLGAGETLVVTIPLLTGETGMLVNTASVSGALPDPVLSNNSDSEETLVVYKLFMPVVIR